jgi:hypothetical protein
MKGEKPFDFDLTAMRFTSDEIEGKVDLAGKGGLAPVIPGEEDRDGPIFNIGDLGKVTAKKPPVINGVKVYSDSLQRGVAKCIRH